MKKTNAVMLVAAAVAGGYGLYRYYKSHTYEIRGCVKDTMKKVKDSVNEISENMM